ncbi:hypothetical protein Rsub_04858 [Raphidocelis subcapitata]|uniref:t-SNARE coiled-coil homology domain-containing protein n=1 Tax=Raphidocelis subcapitata TaxID=307507 RepID=A0A2V0NV17_9CHLO|nr:hypothetical protein Rsub_04858 [Raphidocelis subcapitata]|eukprot:GBF91189.1 hypothetical protein Rsub_04858 [Raphidocelis subcapitata]
MKKAPRPRPPDPFPTARALAERSCVHARALQSAAAAGAAAEAPRLPGAMAALAEQLEGLGAAVSAMERAPSRFRLSGATVKERRAELDALQWEAARVARASERSAALAAAADGPPTPAARSGGGTVSDGGPASPAARGGGATVSDGGGGGGSRGGSKAADAGKAGTFYRDQLRRKGLSHSSPPKDGGARAGSCSSSSSSSSGGGGSSGHLCLDVGVVDLLRGAAPPFERQQRLQAFEVQRREEVLGDAEAKVGRIKGLGQAVHQELESQSLLLGGLREAADAAQLRLRGARRCVAELLRSERRHLIVLLGVLLLLITLLAALY